jgi:hypothetical protein
MMRAKHVCIQPAGGLTILRESRHSYTMPARDAPPLSPPTHRAPRAQVFPHEYRRALDDAAKVALAQSQERELLDQASSMPHGLEGAMAPSGGSALAGLGLG